MDSGGDLGVRRHADCEHHVSGIECPDRAVVLSRAGHCAAELSYLERDQRWDGVLDESADCLVGQALEEQPVADARDGVGRVHMQVLKSRWRHGGEGVHRRIELSQLRDQRAAVGLRADEDRLDDHEALAAHRLRNVRKGWKMKDPADRRDLVRHRLGPFAPGAQHLACPLEGPEHRAGVQLGRGIQLKLDRRDDAEAAAATPNSPEQIGLVLTVQPHNPSLGSDQLDRGDAVGGEPSATRQPAHAASECVADYADVGRGTVENDEALFGGRHDNVLPKRASLDARPSRAGVDLYTTQTRRLHEDRAVQHCKRGRPVAGSLWGNPKTVLTSELDHPDHVLDGLDLRDRERPLINREVPRPTSVVPLGVAWKHKAAREPAPKSMEIARPREVRGTSAAGHERHATSSSFRFSRPSGVPPFAHPVAITARDSAGRVVASWQRTPQG